MRIGEIGSLFKTTQKINFYSTESILQFDALIVDLEYVIVNSKGEKAEFFLKRKKNFSEFILHKKMPIIYFVPSLKQIPVVINNAHTKVFYDYFVPLPKIKIEDEAGHDIMVPIKTPFTETLNNYKEHLSYTAVFESYEGTPILKTIHASKVLGFYDENVVFIPFPKASLLEHETSFLKDLFSATQKIKNPQVNNVLPNWANNFLLPKELAIKKEIENIKSEIETLTKSLISYQEEANKFINKKRLFTGSGDELEKEIQDIFTELGFEIIDSEVNRDDIIMKYNQDIFVVEIKGVSKSAAEKHASQLEKWASTYYEKTDVKPKGILIVNSFKDLAIDVRSEETFPDQMLKYSTQREHCLLSTIQLLGIYYKIQEDNSLKNSLINSLYETVGIYKGFEDWKNFITKD